MTYVTNYVTFRNMQATNEPLSPLTREIPIETMLLYALQGIPTAEIARKVNCTPQNINQRLKPFRERIDAYLQFKSDPAALWEFQEFRVLSSLSESDINKARLAEKATFAGIARDKVRLQRGQSTANIQALTALITSIHAPQTQDVVVSGAVPAFGQEVLPEQESIDSSTPDHDQTIQSPDSDDSGG